MDIGFVTCKYANLLVLKDDIGFNVAKVAISVVGAREVSEQDLSFYLHEGFKYCLLLLSVKSIAQYRVRNEH